jgi:hypothetical protein
VIRGLTAASRGVVDQRLELKYPHRAVGLTKEQQLKLI